MASSGERAQAFVAWMDAFCASYFRHRPVNATFIGVHDFDDRLPDLSTAGMAAMLGEANDLLRRLEALPPEALDTAQEIDRAMARGFLHIQRWESTSRHFGPANPTVATGEAVFGVVSLLLRPFAPLADRLEHVRNRLAAVPDFLESARAAIDAPPAWIARARRECTGARLLLDRGLPAWLAESGVRQTGLEEAADTASQAFGRFDTALADALPRAIDAYACGGEVLDLVLREAHFLDGGANDLERLALERIAEEEEALQSAAPTPSRGAQPEPGASDYLARFQMLWQAARTLTADHDLLTFPDWPVRYVERPLWAREAAPYLYFLPYRSPAPFDSTPVVDYLVPSGADDSTIKLNHVIHHGSLGHHVQNWFAARAESRLGQIAAVDCASRIAMLCGGTMAEGWANYATDLAEEAGFLTPAERVGQHTARLRMAARTVVDIRLHQGRFSLADAIAFYTDRVGMAASAAASEAVKNTLFPGAACMYLAGWNGLWQLRRTVQARQSADFSLHAFHDRVLSFGSVPVALIAGAMAASAPVGAGAYSPYQ